MSLRKWVGEKWVDIGAPKKNGKFQPCGRKKAKGSKRKYPKCVSILSGASSNISSAIKLVIGILAHIAPP